MCLCAVCAHVCAGACLSVCMFVCVYKFAYDCACWCVCMFCVLACAFWSVGTAVYPSVNKCLLQGLCSLKLKNLHTSDMSA